MTSEQLENEISNYMCSEVLNPSDEEFKATLIAIKNSITKIKSEKLTVGVHDFIGRLLEKDTIGRLLAVESLQQSGSYLLSPEIPIMLVVFAYLEGLKAQSSQLEAAELNKLFEKEN